MDTITKERTEAMNDVARLQKEKGGFQEELSQLTSNLELETQKTTKLTNEITSLQALCVDIEGLRNTCETNERTINDGKAREAETHQNFEAQLQSSKAFAEQCIGKKTRELEELRAEKEDALTELRADMQRVQQLADRDRKDATVGLSALKVQVSGLKQRLVDSAVACERADRRESECRQETQQSRELHKRETNELVKQHKSDMLNADNDRQIESAKERATHADLENQIARLDMQNEQGKRGLERCENMERENKRLRTDLETVRIESAQTNTECQLLRQQCVAHKQDLIDAQAQVASLTNKTVRLEQDTLKMRHDLSLKNML